MFELLKKRRSIRRYQSIPVEKEKVDHLIKAALLSPSSRGLRPWEFIVIDDRELLAQLSQAKEHGSSFLKNAPLGIVILGDPQKCDVWVEDCSIASIILHLTAAWMGLGSCWIQIRERLHRDGQSAEDYIRNLLNIPDKFKVEAIIALGYPDEEKASRTEADFPHLQVHHNRFSQPYR
ncbi:MAG TPA: nitroreductase family protein [Syntrophomonadaceae bacterium]|nr:nitroreductase family protein [Syntrophomonadaceae bacterium]